MNLSIQYIDLEQETNKSLTKQKKMAMYFHYMLLLFETKLSLIRSNAWIQDAPTRSRELKDHGKDTSIKESNGSGLFYGEGSWRVHAYKLYVQINVQADRKSVV